MDELIGLPQTPYWVWGLLRGGEGECEKKANKKGGERDREGKGKGKGMNEGKGEG